uniref:Uncharacterized protein n=1 Tax=Cacopsylla melanoneura TaxID=428564 RepID=A0A8D8ZRW3_9HEMI
MLYRVFVVESRIGMDASSVSEEIASLLILYHSHVVSGSLIESCIFVIVVISPLILSRWYSVLGPLFVLDICSCRLFLCTSVLVPIRVMYPWFGVVLLVEMDLLSVQDFRCIGCRIIDTFMDILAQFNFPAMI